jgi:putative ABC transport system permease protein
MGPWVLLYLYRRRLRVHAAQELLAGFGVATAVALVFATLVASDSIAGSAREVVHAAIGPATLQLTAHDTNGLDGHLLERVEALPGVKRAAPLLEQTATIDTSDGHRATVNVIGTTVGLALLNGLARTLPIATLKPGGIGLSQTTAQTLNIDNSAGTPAQTVVFKLRGTATQLRVSAVLGSESFGALSRATVAVMPMRRLQQLAGLPERVSRILVEARAGQEATVRKELLGIAGTKLEVTPADQDLSLLRQALGPSNQASDLFAAISALLGFLFAFNALLLTVPARRQEIADLRVDGTERSAIFQLVVSQSLLLGGIASALGLAAGYALSGAFHQSPGYLAQSFTLGSSTVIGVLPLVLSLAGGLLATCAASIVPLLDLRRRRAVDAVYSEVGVPGHGLRENLRRSLFFLALGLFGFASLLFVLVPAAAIVVCVLLALATMLTVPLALAGVLRIATIASIRYRLTVLPAALTSLRATTVSSLALAATGAVALFGSVALGGSRDDLLRGIDRYTSHYVAGADIWIVNPHDNQAINSFQPEGDVANISRLPGVASVHSFQGSFLNYGGRRVWVIAWPPGARLRLVEDQIVSGSTANAIRQVREGGWITLSAQVAAQHHARVGDTLQISMPTGEVPFKIAATTTNFGWTPGAILMNTVDYSRAWGNTAPSAIGVDLTPNADAANVRRSIVGALGGNSGLEVLSADTRRSTIDASASEGLSQLGEIAALLIAAAILAMIAALGSSIWQRRATLSEFRLEGTQPRQLRRVLLVEASLMLGAGCLTGALAGIYGQIVIDSYLKNVTGFPVASFATGQHPLEIFAFVIATVLAVTAIPGLLASRVSPTFALNE